MNVTKTYTFGRDISCDVELSSNTLKFQTNIINALSKRHFEIRRVSSLTFHFPFELAFPELISFRFISFLLAQLQVETAKDKYTELTDCSSNGTFINGVLVGSLFFTLEYFSPFLFSYDDVLEFCCCN